MRIALVCLLITSFGLASRDAQAIDRLVGTTGAFETALAAAQPGDSITLIPGVYGGGHFRAGLTEVTIRSQDPANPAIIRGGTNGIQLSDATRVTLEHLIFEQQTGNGLNIDDGGSFATPATDITLRDLVVRDMNAGGNNDGIKLSGVTGFLIDHVQVTNWGPGGSAIDPVGSHNGLIQNSQFVSTVATGGSAIRPKGGSKNITIRANRVSLPPGAGRAIQAGGSTGAEFFRFIDGDSGYEAAGIAVEGNYIIGGSSAISWVNIDGGVFHHNEIRDPGDWAFRLLNENVGAAIIDTQNGVMADNIVAFDGDIWRRAGNYDGPEVLEETFTFARNRWFNSANPTAAGSTPQLPTAETDGVYGVDPGEVEVRVWEFSWGKWWTLSGASSITTAPENLQGYANLLLAEPGATGEFSPLDDDPLTGEWAFTPAAEAEVTGRTTHLVFVQPENCAICSTLPGDFDRSGEVDHGDFGLWKTQYGLVGPALADGNGDGRVDASDYAVWRHALGTSVEGAPLPEPMAVSPVVTVFLFGGVLRRRRSAPGSWETCEPMPLGSVLRCDREKFIVSREVSRWSS